MKSPSISSKGQHLPTDAEGLKTAFSVLEQTKARLFPQRGQPWFFFFLASTPCALAMMPIMRAHTAAVAFVKWAGKQLWL